MIIDGNSYGLVCYLQMLAASYELHKFYYNAKEVLEMLEEKYDEMSQELGKDAQSVTILKRKHEAYQSDLHTFKQQVSLSKLRGFIWMILYPKYKTHQNNVHIFKQHVCWRSTLLPTFILLKIDIDMWCTRVVYKTECYAHLQRTYYWRSSSVL